MVDIKVTTVMDLELKTEFELAFPSKQNPKKYKEALDRGALSMLEEVNPLKASELRIARYLELIEEERKKQDEFRLMQKIKRTEVKKEEKEDFDLEDARIKKYEEIKQSLATQIINNSIDWKLIAAPNIFNFKTPLECERWGKDRLLKDNLIGCENCRKWKIPEQYCPENKRLTKPFETCRNWVKKR